MRYKYRVILLLYRCSYVYRRVHMKAEEPKGWTVLAVNLPPLHSTFSLRCVIWKSTGQAFEYFPACWHNMCQQRPPVSPCWGWLFILAPKALSLQCMCSLPWNLPWASAASTPLQCLTHVLCCSHRGSQHFQVGGFVAEHFPWDNFTQTASVGSCGAHFQQILFLVLVQHHGSSLPLSEIGGVF